MSFTEENNIDTNTTNSNKKQTIFQSPFVMSNYKPINEISSKSTPFLKPLKRKHTSPVKRQHRRNTSITHTNYRSLNSGSQDMNLQHSSNKNNCFKREKGFSLLDDFQHGDLKQGIDLFTTPVLTPPQNSETDQLFNRGAQSQQSKSISNNNDNRDFFSFANKNSTSNNNGNFSLFSMIPTTTVLNAFDFNSYLRSVTSNLQLIPKVQNKQSNQVNDSKLLDLSKPMKLDILQENDRSVIADNHIMDDLELDCVVRSSVWDSDADTEDELELNLNLDNSKDEDIENTSLTNSNKYDINNDDYLKYFNQSMTSKPPTQIHSLTEPKRSPVSSKLSFHNDISSFAEPVKIYSDLPIQSERVRSPGSSQGSEETLHDEENVIPSRENNRKRVLNFNIEPESFINASTKRGSKETQKCSPHHHIFVENLKSALKPIPKSLLNLIVESSDGSLEDATKYATEINAQNSEGIPIPEKTTELVNIPTTASSASGVRKSAIVRGVRARSGTKKKAKRTHHLYLGETVSINNPNDNNKPNTLSERHASIIQANENRQNIMSNNNMNNFKGFYSLHEQQQFNKRNVDVLMGIDNNENKENISANTDININHKINGTMSTGYKRVKVAKSEYNVDSNGKKSVNWAETLEW